MHSTRLLARHTPRNSSRTRPANSCQWGSAGSRSLSEKQVKVDKNLRRAAAERFFVFRGIPHFVPGGEIRKSLLEFGLILGQPPRYAMSSSTAAGFLTHSNASFRSSIAAFTFPSHNCPSSSFSNARRRSLAPPAELIDS